MRLRRLVAQLDLVALLLFVVVLELVLNRLAVPVLRPHGNKAPPDWHRNLDMVGLYLFHFASILAIGVVAHEIWQRVARPGLARPFRAVLGVTSVAFLLLSFTAVLSSSEVLAFRLEAAFAAVLATLAVALAFSPRADGLAKLGIFVLLVPFAMHFYGTLRLRVFTDSEYARWTDLPDRIRDLGQHAVALAALASPLLFGPRPLVRALARPAPMVLSAFVASIGAVILRKHLEVGMELAMRGLGMELGPGAPSETMALYVAGAAAAVWTMASCLLAESPNRRLIGFGFALVVAAGYGFVWPLQFLCVVGGFAAITAGALEVRAEEQGALVTVAPRFSSPPIPPEAWQGYVDALARALEAEVRAQEADGQRETTLCCARGGRPALVRLVRDARSPAGLEALSLVVAGAPEDLEPPLSPPAWTMTARADHMLAAGVHPPPPSVEGGTAVRTGDAAFDRRFKVLEARPLTGALLDEGLRARVTAMLDGWIAVWPGRCIEYRVHPGRGAPLDHPVPVTVLAFRAGGGTDAPGVDRLVGVVDLITEIGARAVATGAGASAGAGASVGAGAGTGAGVEADADSGVDAPSRLG